MHVFRNAVALFVLSVPATLGGCGGYSEDPAVEEGAVAQVGESLNAEAAVQSPGGVQPPAVPSYSAHSAPMYPAPVSQALTYPAPVSQAPTSPVPMYPARVYTEPSKENPGAQELPAMAMPNPSNPGPVNRWPLLPVRPPPASEIVISSPLPASVSSGGPPYTIIIGGTGTP